jgi:hypothetical protein
VQKSICKVNLLHGCFAIAICMSGKLTIIQHHVQETLIHVPLDPRMKKSVARDQTQSTHTEVRNLELLNAIGLVCTSELCSTIKGNFQCFWREMHSWWIGASELRSGLPFPTCI